MIHRWEVCDGGDEDRDDEASLQVQHRGKREDEDGIQKRGPVPYELQRNPSQHFSEKRGISYCKYEYKYRFELRRNSRQHFPEERRINHCKYKYKYRFELRPNPCQYFPEERGINHCKYKFKYNLELRPIPRQQFPEERRINHCEYKYKYNLELQPNKRQHFPEEKRINHHHNYCIIQLNPKWSHLIKVLESCWFLVKLIKPQCWHTCSTNTNWNTNTCKNNNKNTLETLESFSAKPDLS